MFGVRSHWKRPGPLGFGVCVFVMFSVSTALACSTVAFRNPERPLLAYSFDFEATSAGFLVINPAKASKRSVMDGDAASWTSRLGNITLNQIGPGMPAVGMNTAGLVVSLMWNEEATYAGNRDGPIVSELEFIQRLLDTSGSVPEALSRIEGVNIRGLVPIHYFLFDASGRAAAITPTVDGLLVHEGDSLPIPAITNTSYTEAIEHLQSAQGSTDSRKGQSSLDRFTTAAETLQAREDPTPAQAFDVLDSLANPTTRWQVVFDPGAKRISLRLKRSHRQIDLNLATTDFGCSGHPLGVNLREIPADFPGTAPAPIAQSDLTATMSEVLQSMKATAHLGRPEVAAQLSAGLLKAHRCVQ